MTRVLRSLLPLAVLLPVTLVAQVGHFPDASPYRDIPGDRYLQVFGGQVMGNGGPLLLAPQDGPMVGARIDFRGKSTLGLSLGGWYMMTERFIVDADKPPATRVSGPIDHRIFGGELTIQFNLTGGKAWRGFAPYTGLGLGAAFGDKTPAADTSGYAFGTKLFFAPMVGTRVMIGSRAFLKLEGRAFFWNIRYPQSYFDEPAQAPGTPENPNAVNPTGRRGQYTPAPALLVGLGVKF
jgi:hypothetical protein